MESAKSESYLFYVRPFFWLMLQFFLSRGAQTNKSWFDCPDNILSVSWETQYIQWEQRNQNSRSEWFCIKNCLLFVLQVLTTTPPPTISMITMKSLPKVKTDCFLNYTALGCCSGNILHSDRWLQRPLAPYWVKGRILETFRFEDENHYEYEIWFKVFSRILKK